MGVVLISLIDDSGGNRFMRIEGFGSVFPYSSQFLCLDAAGMYL